MRLLLTGGDGLLGTEIATLARSRSLDVVATGRAELDIVDRGAADRLVERFRPEVVVHCAAFTRVDAAEAETALAMAVNRDGAARVAAAAERVGAHFVYLSTDYVFDGEASAPYPPGHEPAPISQYGRSKLAGELASSRASPGCLVIRTGWLYGGARRNFVSGMLDRGRRGEALTVVADQVGGPSWTRNVASGVLDLVGRGARGTWHVADRGAASWADLTREALRVAGIDAVVTDIASEDWGAPAPRPRYSVLDVSGTEKLLGRRMPHWREALERFLT